MTFHGYRDVFKEAFSRWLADRVPRLGAALAFYSMLSLAPLLVIAVAIAGSMFGEEAARRQIVAEIEDLVGGEGAQAIQAMLASADRPEIGGVAALLGIIVLLVGAAGVFGELQDALNTIWGVESRPGRGLWAFLSDRFMSFAMVLGTGFLLLVSLVLSAVLAALANTVSGITPGLPILGIVMNVVLSLVVFTLLFALIFKIVPDVRLAWNEVWFGAIITAVLFSAGKVLLGLYLGQGAIGSAFGAAGSLVVLTIWIYYSAQILYFGAEITVAYSLALGKRVEPARNSMFVRDVRATATKVSQKHASLSSSA
jgi:membrane protein